MLSPSLETTTNVVISTKDNFLLPENNREAVTQLVSSIRKPINDVTDLLTKRYISKQQQDFDRNLKFHEKYLPFFGNSKEEQFKDNLKFKSQILHMGLTTGVDLLMTFIESGFFDKILLKKHLTYSYESLLNNCQYIQQKELSPVQKIKITRLFQSSGIKTPKKIDSIFNNSLKKTDYSEMHEKLFISPDFRAFYLSQMVDILDSDMLIDTISPNYSRYKLFAHDYLGFTDNNIDTISASNGLNDLAMSRILDLTRFSLNEIIPNTLSNINLDKEFVSNIVDNDPFEKRREKIKKGVLIASNIGIHATLSTMVGPAADMLLVASGSILSNTIAKNDPKLAKKILTTHTNTIIEERNSKKVQDAIAKRTSASTTRS